VKGVTTFDAAQATILVTGATDGLGRRVAQELAAMGTTVLLHGRSPERLDASLEELRSQMGSEKANSYKIAPRDKWTRARAQGGALSNRS
jgi:short-subunit dehydrogenase